MGVRPSQTGLRRTRVGSDSNHKRRRDRPELNRRDGQSLILTVSNSGPGGFRQTAPGRFTLCLGVAYHSLGLSAQADPAA